MRIEQKPEGWTVVNDEGQIRLRNKEGQPMFVSSYREAVNQCNANGLYTAKADNPAGYPEGSLISFNFGGNPGDSDVPERPQG